MGEIPEGWDKDLYDKLSFDFLIECAENKKIEAWNALYKEYLESEWNRLYPKREWDPKNVLELVNERLLYIAPNFIGKDFREAISRGVHFYDAHLEGAEFREAHLEEAQFWNAHLEGVNFWGAHLKGTEFLGAHLEGVFICEAYLEGAEFWASHLEGADFQDADLEGAKFNYAIVDGETLFAANSIDKNTDFTGTALSAARIDPVLRTKLEKNIREIQWNDWYKNHRFLRIIMRPFWFLTDYGASTIRPVSAFILWNTLFAIIYYLWLGNDFEELMTPYTSPFLTNIGDNIVIFLTDWMKSNLMIISLTDMATIELGLWTLFAVFLHVFVGYFILAALVARLSIMFQNLSPNDN